MTSFEKQVATAKFNAEKEKICRLKAHEEKRSSFLYSKVFDYLNYHFKQIEKNTQKYQNKIISNIKANKKHGIKLFDIYNSSTGFTIFNWGYYSVDTRPYIYTDSELISIVNEAVKDIKNYTISELLNYPNAKIKLSCCNPDRCVVIDID